MFTIAAIARRYDLPESTARYYCKRFRDYLPHAGEGKRRRFLPEALPVFEAILEAMGRNKSASSVEAELQQKFSTASVTEPDTRRSIPAAGAQNQTPQDSKQLHEFIRKQTQALEKITSLLTALLEHQGQAAEVSTANGNDSAEPALQATSEADISTLEQRLSDLENRFTNLQNSVQQELKHLNSMQDQSERIHQQDMEQLRKWLGHLAKEQAKEHNKEQAKNQRSS